MKSKNIFFVAAVCMMALFLIPGKVVDASELDGVEFAQEIEVGKNYDVVLEQKVRKWFCFNTDDEYKTYTVSFPTNNSAVLTLYDQNLALVKRDFNNGVSGGVVTFNPDPNEKYYIELYYLYAGSSDVVLMVSGSEDEPNIMDDAKGVELGELVDGEISSEFDKDWFSISTGDYEEEYTFFTTLDGKGFYTFGIYDSNKKELAKVTCGETIGYNRDYTNTMKLERNESYYLCFSADEVCDYSFKVTKNVAKSISDAVNMNLNSKKNGFTASWNVIPSAKGYELQYSTDSSFKKSKKLTTAKKSKKITGLKSGATYYVRVRAYAKNSDGKKIYSKWSKAKSIVAG